jgi:hypothetical protein
VSDEKPKGYEWTAVVGVLIGLAPDIITAFLTDPDAPTLSKGARFGLRMLGLLVAAQGLPLVKRK